MARSVYSLALRLAAVISNSRIAVVRSNCLSFSEMDGFADRRGTVIQRKRVPVSNYGPERRSIGLRTPSPPGALKDMGVDHRGGDVAVPQKLLHRPDVMAVFQGRRAGKNRLRAFVRIGWQKTTMATKPSQTPGPPISKALTVRAPRKTVASQTTKNYVETPGIWVFPWISETRN